MKETQDFLDFQKYFAEYQKRFGLTGYKVYFEHKPIENAFANITIDSIGRIATARLNSKNHVKCKPIRTLKESAKHEALHLLLGKLEDLAYQRFINKEQLYEAVEEVVYKVEELVED